MKVSLMYGQQEENVDSAPQVRESAGDRQPLGSTIDVVQARLFR